MPAGITWIYPTQYLMLGLGFICILLVFFRTERASRIISAILGFFYGWIGIEFYLVYFRDFMPMPLFFAILFFAQALIFILEGTIRNRITFRFKPDLYGLTGAILILYGILGYQCLEYLLGRGYPEISIIYPDNTPGACPERIYPYIHDRHNRRYWSDNQWITDNCLVVIQG
jgi:hypothetical protein